MHFAAADETYEQMWYCSLVDRNVSSPNGEHSEYEFYVQLACHKTRPSFWHYCAVSSLTSLAYAEYLRGMSMMGNNVLLFPLAIFLELPFTNSPSTS